MIQTFQNERRAGLPACRLTGLSSPVFQTNSPLKSHPHRQAGKLHGRNVLINTRLQPGAERDRRGKNRLNGFSLARSWCTALKRGVNETIFAEQPRNLLYSKYPLNCNAP
jgi:hypothetical protein